jgi:hypothetical protein
MVGGLLIDSADGVCIIVPKRQTFRPGAESGQASKRQSKLVKVRMLGPNLVCQVAIKVLPSLGAYI